MHTVRTVAALLAVAGAAFLAGRLSTPPWSTALAAAQPPPRDEPKRPPAAPRAERRAVAPQDWDMAAPFQPGLNHTYLEPLAGEWRGEVRMWEGPDTEPVRAAGRISRAWVLDGRYLRETVAADTEWGPFEGLGFIGYNNLEGQYEFVWMENMATAIAFGTGVYDPDRKVLSYWGSHRDPRSRKLVRSMVEINLSAPGRTGFTEHSWGPDGRKYKSLEGSFERLE